MDGSTQSTRTSLVDQLGLVGGSVRLHMGTLFLTKIPQFDQAPFIDPPSPPPPPTHTHIQVPLFLSTPQNDIIFHSSSWHGKKIWKAEVGPHWRTCRPAHVYMTLYMYLSVSLSVPPSVWVSLSVYRPSVCVFVCLSVCSFICLLSVCLA